MFVDNALAFDPSTRRCDLVFDGADLALETTPATAMIVSLGCNRRARSDDPLPAVTSDFYAPGSLMAKGGWVGDALDARGEMIGSRLWLLEGAKGAARTTTTTGPGETTRRRSESYATEALAAFRAMGLATGVKAIWVRPGGLALTAVVANTEVTVRLAVG